jgi:spermidine synthase
MVCEVAWTRAFAQVLGSSTFAFTIMLSTVLTGIACGGLLFHALRPRFKPGLIGLALLLAGIGLGIRIALPLFNLLPYAVARLFPIMAKGPFHLHALQTLLCASVMALPTLLMGASLPWAVAAAEPGPVRIGSASGACYSANTLGAIAGSVLGGLVLVPLLGTERALGSAAWLYLAAAGLSLFLSSGSWLPRALCAAGAAALMAEASFFCPSWDPRVLTSGAFFYGVLFEDLGGYKGFLQRVRMDRLLFYEDGPGASVAVLESPAEERYLRINGKTDASTGRDSATQLLTGYLPLLMHPGVPKRGLIIGLGSGASAAAMATAAGMAAVDVVEIEPAVTRAAPLFEKANLGVLRAPRVRVVHADARQFISIPGEPYDAIGSEPSNPWMAGVAGLYTREAFSAAKARLTEDGVFCQWLHSYRMSVADFKMILKTFCSVFPHTMLMSNGGNDFFLLGSKKPWDPDYGRIERFFSANALFARDIPGARVGFDDPFTFLAATFKLTDAELRRFSQEARVNSDDLPFLEFSAPRWMLAGQNALIQREIASSKRTALPEGLRGFKETARTRALLHALQGAVYLDTGGTAEAEAAFLKALKVDPRCSRAELGLGRLEEAAGKDEAALKRYRAAVEHDPRYAKARFYLGALYVHLGRAAEGRRQLEAGLKLAPADPMGSLHLGISYLGDGRREDTLRLVHAALARPIPDARTHENLAILRRAAGE